jgi:hypothetical protein
MDMDNVRQHSSMPPVTEEVVDGPVNQFDVVAAVDVVPSISSTAKHRGPSLAAWILAHPIAPALRRPID